LIHRRDSPEHGRGDWGSCGAFVSRDETRCVCVCVCFVMYPPSNVVVFSSALNDFSLSLVGGWRRGDGDEEIEEMRRWACLVRCVNRALRFPFN
jgi:hypothetical protein